MSTTFIPKRDGDDDDAKPQGNQNGDEGEGAMAGDYELPDDIGTVPGEHTEKPSL